MRTPGPPGGFRTPQTPATPNGAAASPADRKAAEEQQYFQQQGQAPTPAQTVSSTNPKIAAQQAADNKNIVRRKLTGYVGFANLPNQWHRKSVRKGFNFNVMVVGEFRRGTQRRVHDGSDLHDDN
jgi:septin 7